MNQFDGELAALQHQRRMEALSGPSGVESAVDMFASWASEAGIPGTGLFRKALKSGQTPVETLVAQLESAASEEIRRIWEYLQDKEEEQKKFAERLKSQEAQCAYFAAVLHGLRTSDPKRQTRLAVLTVNSVYADATEAESLDDMMRAAVELKDRDIHVLKKVAETQSKHGQHFSLVTTDGAINKPREVWQELEREGFIKPSNHMEIRSSLARLQSLGLGAEIQTMESSWLPRFLVTLDGEKLLSRLGDVESAGTGA